MSMKNSERMVESEGEWREFLLCFVVEHQLDAVLLDYRSDSIRGQV